MKMIRVVGWNMYVDAAVCADGTDSNWILTFLGDVVFDRAWLFDVVFWLTNRFPCFCKEL